MTVVTKAGIASPVLPKQSVEVEPLGGEVVVRGLLLVELLGVQQRIATLHQAAGGGDHAASVSEIVPDVLALCVLDADGVSLFSRAEWQIFGGQHQAAALNLFNVAWRLSGMDRAGTAKN